MKAQELRKTKSSFEYDAEVFNLEKFDDTFKSDEAEEGECGDIFEMTVGTPKIGHK